MTTITINKRTKEGKLLFEMAQFLAENSKGIVITEDAKSEKTHYNADFVKKVLDSSASKKRYEVKNVDDLWESL